MEKFVELGKEFGLEGKELLAFVKEQQDEEKRRIDEEREERQRERDSKKLEADERKRVRVYELEQKEAERRHELAMKQLKLQRVNTEVSSPTSFVSVFTAKVPKLAPFIDGKDDLDSYLLRFERFAKNNKCEESTWSTSLSALLTGKALDVYSRLSETAAVDYKQLKEARLKRYDLTKDGFGSRFREGKQEEGESPGQFTARLNRYLSRWIELSKTEKSYEGVRDLFIKEQFLNSCPVDLSIYLRERDLESLEELSQSAEQFLVARGKNLLVPAKQHNKAKQELSGNYNQREGVDEK